MRLRRKCGSDCYVWENFTDFSENFCGKYLLPKAINFGKYLILKKRKKRLCILIKKVLYILSSDALSNALSKNKLLRLKKRLLIALAVIESLVIFVLLSTKIFQ
jgi:hypothetical protein